ncbi:MAG: glycerol kinase [Bacteroidetes bacterium 4572_117]|nr:MAG: glycerol kinase [Bacteroidetes bacterium 4572_117]
MSNYILALDQGTSSSRAILFDKNLDIVGSSQKEFPQIYPKPGWVEHDPEQIWQSQYLVIIDLLADTNIEATEISAIGITNQRETTLVWDKNTGIPIYNAIVWQDKRTSDFCSKLKHKGFENFVKKTTGLVIDSYFSATKINWILDNVEGAREKAKKGELLFGTVDTWLIWKLTDGKAHVTDYSNASRTLLFNIRELKWDNKLLEIFNVPASVLPEVKPSSGIVAKTSAKLFNGAEIKISGIAGDQQAALFGQKCFNKGMAKNTYGTGCFILMNTGDHIVESNKGLLSTIAWNIDGKTDYALEGSVFIAGAAIKWLKEGIKLIKDQKETQSVAESIETDEDIYVVPAFSGLGAPHWDMYARGAILGLTQGVTDKHIVKATLDALAYRTKDVLDAMSSDSGINLSKLNVDGGASVNDYLMQFQADILNTPVERPKIIETTALGAALLAGMAVGIWTKDKLAGIPKTDKCFKVKMGEGTRNKLYKGWLKAIEKAKGWVDEED